MIRVNVRWKSTLEGSFGLRESTAERRIVLGFRPVGKGVVRKFTALLPLGLDWSYWESNSPPGGAGKRAASAKGGLCFPCRGDCTRGLPAQAGLRLGALHWGCGRHPMGLGPHDQAPQNLFLCPGLSSRSHLPRKLRDALAPEQERLRESRSSCSKYY